MNAEDLLIEELGARVAGAPRIGRHKEWVYGSLAELLLERGRLFVPAELPPTVGRLPPRQCYANAFALASVRPDVVYAEGYAVCDLGDGDLLHLQHAWCVAMDGTVVDPTWATPGLAYLGLPLGPWAGPPALGPGLIYEIDNLVPVLKAGLPADALVDVGRQPVPSRA